MSLTVQQLSYAYDEKYVLKNLSFSLPQGLSLLLGPNGAGKSTLFALLTGIIRLKNAQILYQSLHINQHRQAIMRKIGVVFQQNTLDLDLSVQQNLAYFASLHGIRANKALLRIRPILDALELSGRLHEKVRKLNLGHRRRVELARCLIHSPRYLLLDEPTVGLDIASRQCILNFIRAQAANGDLTVLWATHLLEEVQPQDNLLVLTQGQLSGEGLCRDLMRTHELNSVQALFEKLAGEQ